MRRIVTGHNQNGKSKIFIDSGPARSIGEDVGGLYEIWNTSGNIIDSTDKSDPADSEIVLSPSVNGTKFRYCLLYTSPSPRDRTRSRMPSSA